MAIIQTAGYLVSKALEITLNNVRTAAKEDWNFSIQVINISSKSVGIVLFIISFTIVFKHAKDELIVSR